MIIMIIFAHKCFIYTKNLTMLNSTLDLIAKTPLLQLDKLTKEGEGKIYAKLEFLQPGGSIKDRAALQIIKDAYHSGKLKEGQTVVEMTSGNMGAGLALVCRQFGNPFVAVMSKGNSPERRKIMQAFGCEIVLTDQIDGEKGRVTGKDIEHATTVARQIALERNGFFVDQFNSPSCVNAHFETTGPEIMKDLPEINIFIASVGTGGTFIGTARFLKSLGKGIQCYASEPESSAILKTGKVTDPRHIIQGTGYGFVPPQWDPALADDIITVTDKEVMDTTKRLALEQGLYVGYSSGANVAASLKFLRSYQDTKSAHPQINSATYQNINIVTIVCDSAYKYSDL
jgi:cysteine synthase A